MTTTTEPKLDLPCPEWCTLEQGHRWDSSDPDYGDLRSHEGPRFGFVSTGAEEIASKPGSLEYYIVTSESEPLTEAHDVFIFATDLIRAGQWLAERVARQQQRRHFMLGREVAEDGLRNVAPKDVDERF